MVISNKVASYLFLFSLMSLFSCNEDEIIEIDIITMNATNITPGSALLNGELKILGGISEISDYGFILSKSMVSTINDAESIFSLGSISTSSTFRKEAAELEIATSYYATSYYVRNDEVVYGETINFSTTPLSISMVDPLSGAVGEEIIISTDLQDIDLAVVQVFFGEVKADVVGYEESLKKLTILVPFGTCGEVTVRIDISEQTTSSTELFDVSEWKFEFDVASNVGYEEHAFTIGTIAYFKENDGNTTFRAYDVSKNEEVPVQDMEVNQFHGINFAVNDKGYIGLGNSTSEGKGIFEYSPSSDLWTRKADFPGEVTFSAVSFSYQNKGYFFWGGSPTNDPINYKSIWEYDPDSDSWAVIGTVPSDNRQFATHFIIGDFLYAGLGSKFEMNSEFGPLNDFWKYDLINRIWTPIASFPGASKNNALAFTKEGKGYVGMGDEPSTDIWEYDPSSDQWVFLGDMEIERARAVGFNIGERGFIGFGFRESGNGRLDIVEYVPCD